MKSIALVVTLSVAVAVMGRTAAAQSQVESTPAFPVQKVDIGPLPEYFKTGKGAVFHGTVDATGTGFVVQGLGIMMPVMVTVFAAPDKPVQGAVGKDGWATPSQTGVTSARNGAITFLFRSQDYAQIKLSSAAEPRTFDLVIWVGDEKTDYPDMGSPLQFGKAEQAKRARTEPPPTGSSTPSHSAQTSGGSGGGGSNALWVIAALLGVGILLLGVIVFRRKR